ncbi:IS110 family transposase [Amphibacillus jilinensis]|uniref:IS110 family transposase n=1 Tax=Amphibacillus jilinensis TaxID=1216008 RepID=UPI00036620E8|nr:IS110 family transposase [Amphibacillus jilinensis]
MEVKQAATRAVGIKRIQALKEVAENSVGLQGGLQMGRQEIRYLLDQYQALEERLIALEAQLKELVLHIPGSEEMMAIKGVSAITVAGFFAEVGDLSNYQDPRQIIKLAGLNLKLNQSGYFKGQTTITKRGRKRLRNLLYQVARPLSLHNDGFKQLHHYYRYRTTNPLSGKQSFIALSRKLIKIFFLIGTRNCTFSEEQMIRDIPMISDTPEAA